MLASTLISAATLVISAPAGATAPPLAPLDPISPPPVAIPSSTSANGFAGAANGGITHAWAAPGSTCSTSLMTCASEGLPAGCDLPVDKPIDPNSEACNMAIASGYSDPLGPAGLIAVQSCFPGNGNSQCGTFTQSDIPGDAALGFDITAPPYNVYDPAYQLTFTPELSLQYFSTIEDSRWPFSSVTSEGNVSLYVYDLTTGSVAGTQTSVVYTSSAYGLLKATTAGTGGPSYLGSPLTLTISATPGHTYQAWVWASADSNAGSGANGYASDQYMDIFLNGISWQATAVPAAGSAAPAIASISPTTGDPGTIVQITGAGFSPQFPPVVSFGSAPAQVTCYSPSSCQAIVPAGAGTVAVTAAFGPSFVEAAGSFTYAGAPQCVARSTCGTEIISATSPFQSVSTITVSCQSAPQEVQHLVGGTWVSLASFASNASLPSSTVADIYDIGLQSSAGVATSGAAVGSVQQIRACTVASGGTVCDAPASVSIVSCPIAGSGSSGPGAGGCSPRSCGTGYYWDSARCGCAKDFCACGGVYPKCTVCQ